MANRLHTLYFPLKAAADIERNLTATPVQELGLHVTIENRTGDTSSYIKRANVLPP